MISVFSYNRVLKEQDIIERGCRSQVAMRTDEKLNFVRAAAAASGEAVPETLTDIIYYEIADRFDVGSLRKLRQKEEGAALMILTSPSVSPMEYLKPGIAPDLLLLRPFGQKEFDQVNTELFDAFLERMNSPNPDDHFVLNSREGRTLISYGRIMFFEASNKKINLRTDHEEYDFYDSIENLQTVVPDWFIRCHRSYLVNTRKIRKVKMSEGLIEMEGGAVVPLSRTYKQDLKILIK